MKRRSFLLSAASLAAAAVGGLWVKDNIVWPRPDVVFDDPPEWFSFVPRTGGLPIVDAQVAGRPVRALIDSGAQYSVIDQQLADDLRAEGLAGGERISDFAMPMLAYGVGGQAQVGRGMCVSLELAGASVPALRVAILQLGPLASEAAGPQVSLIVGRDLLAAMVVEIDVEQERLRLSAPALWHPAPDMRPIAVDRGPGGGLGIEVRVEGRPLAAIVDTGATGRLSLARTAARDAGLLDGRESREGESLVLGGVARAQWLTAARLEIGDEQWRDVPVAVFADSPLPNYPDALVGMGAFQGHRVVMDLGRRRLFVSRPLDITVG